MVVSNLLKMLKLDTGLVLRATKVLLRLILCNPGLIGKVVVICKVGVLPVDWVYVVVTAWNIGFVKDTL